MISGLSTPKTTFKDPALTIPHPNPVPANGAGEFPEIFLDGEPYRVRLLDQTGVQINLFDPVVGTVFAGGAILSETFFATAGQALFTFAGITYAQGNNQLNVHVNGIFQTPLDNYVETTPTSITFSTPLELGDKVVVKHESRNTFTTVNGVATLETATATAGQTLFTFSTITYTIGANARFFQVQ